MVNNTTAWINLVELKTKACKNSRQILHSFKTIFTLTLKAKKYRKIVFILIACLIAPALFYIKTTSGDYGTVHYKGGRYFDYKISSLNDYLIALWGFYYLRFSFFSLVLIFIPFQFIKDYHYRNIQPLTFFKKVLILSAIVMGWMFLWGIFSNIWIHPYYYNLLYLAFSIFFGLFFTSFFYVTIDRYVENESGLKSAL